MTRLLPEWPDWSGETVVIVASGPSAAEVDLEQGRGRAKFLAVKDGWRLCPWADHLYACDNHWWTAYKGARDFQGQRIAYDAATLKAFPDLSFLKVEIKGATAKLLFDRVGLIGWGGNSGFHALNLALQFGAKAILLVGFDMRVDRGRHFFGEHPYQAKRPERDKKPSARNVEIWRKVFDDMAPVIAARGVKVINCSPISALRAYPKMTFEEALDACREVHRGFRPQADPGRDDRLQGRDGEACHNGLCGACGQAGQGRDCEEAAPEEGAQR